jgi:hypothetical protein
MQYIMYVYSTGHTRLDPVPRGLTRDGLQRLIARTKGSCVEARLVTDVTEHVGTSEWPEDFRGRTRARA